MVDPCGGLDLARIFADFATPIFTLRRMYLPGCDRRPSSAGQQHASGDRSASCRSDGHLGPLSHLAVASLPA
jgi:hypothetical protein